MKRITLLSVVFILSIFTTKAQIGRDDDVNTFSVDVNFPMLVGGNELKDYTSGSLDIGVKWNFLHLGPIDLGIACDGGLMNGDIDMYYIKPKINGELRILMFSPYAGIGYTYLSQESSEFNIDDSFSGINASLGLKFHLLPKLYINAAYDFTSLDDGDLDDKQFQMAKFGAGLQF